MPRVEMPLRHQPFPRLPVSSWLVFLGVCGNTSSEEKNSTANSGVFSTDSLSDGPRGSFSSHTQDRERNTEELEVPQTQSVMPRLRPQLSALPFKVIILLLHSRTRSKENRPWSLTALAQQFFFVLYLPRQADSQHTKEEETRAGSGVWRAVLFSSRAAPLQLCLTDGKVSLPHTSFPFALGPMERGQLHVFRLSPPQSPVSRMKLCSFSHTQRPLLCGFSVSSDSDTNGLELAPGPTGGSSKRLRFRPQSSHWPPGYPHSCLTWLQTGVLFNHLPGFVNFLEQLAEPRKTVSFRNGSVSNGNQPLLIYCKGCF